MQLEPTIKQQLTDCLERLTTEGKLRPRSVLEGYYSTFRRKFGPDVLASLDGEILLDTMHALGTKDSLVYWLEFKDDEEFPSPSFGSIAGGSAFKFGVFRYNDGTWVTGGAAKGRRVLSLDEAIEIARRHRDQFVKGAAILSQLRAGASDDEYRELQNRLDREAPNVSDLGWGHKYFSLLFPDKLDDFHSPDWQRFHLLKLQQVPPEGKGRYLCAGRFVSAANELNVPMNHLDAALNALHGAKHRYWRIGTSDGEASRNQWPMMRDGECVAIGWPEIGDLSALDIEESAREKVIDLLSSTYPNSPQVLGKWAAQIVRFKREIAKEDIVLAADGGTILAIGRVVGDYRFELGAEFPHRRDVDWLSISEWPLPVAEGLQTAVSEIKAPKNILDVEQRAQRDGVPSQSAKAPTNHPPTPTHRLTGIPGRIQSVLERKSQCILYGPPGTGKTYWAERAALDLASLGAFGKPFAGLSAAEQDEVAGNQTGPGLVRTCCFHPAYGYEDFLEGYRPETVQGSVAFRLRDGVFKRLCKEAAQYPQRKFYLLIDEINRGDIPRIFGELLSIVESDKRGKAILLPVSGETFRVPPNVYLIGTMNTADRSISLLDAALRRRFGFIELMPDSQVLGAHSIASIPLAAWFEALNRRICEHVGRDARNLQVGHSYLLHGGRPIKDLASFRRVLRDDVVPLLEEYCYEDFEALQRILGNSLVDTEQGRIRDELFEEGQDDALVRALLEPCADILAVVEGELPAIDDAEPTSHDEEDGVGQ